MFRIESYRRGVVLSSAFNFISKLLLFLQSVAIAYYFGTESKTDVFFYCYATIALMAVFINSLDSSVLIPEAMRLSEHESKEESIKFLNFFICIYFFIGAIVSLILYFNPVNVFMMLSNFDQAVLQKNLNILLFSIPLFTVTIITNLLANILASYKFFTIPMMAGMINNLISLISLIFFHNILDIISLLIGLIFAYLINIFILIYLMKTQLGWDFSFKIIKINKKIFKNIFYAQIGNVTSVLSSYIPLYLLSGFNVGVIAALTYGQKTADMPNQLVTSQFSSVLGIKFNELYAKEDFVRLNDVFNSSIKLLLFIMIPISAFILIYCDIIISIFFKQGAFDAVSVERSAEFLKYFGLLLPIFAINTIVSRLFMAGQKIKQAFLYQGSLNLVSILSIFICVKFMGVIGYPIALLITGTANIFFCYLLLKLYFPFVQYTSIILCIFKIVFFNGILIVFTFFIKENIVMYNEFMQIFIGFFVYLILILLFNHFLNINKDVKSIYSVKR